MLYGLLNRQDFILLAVGAVFLVTGKWLVLVLCLVVLLWLNPGISTQKVLSTGHPRSIAVLSSGRDNNFNLIRILAAWAVLYSHNYPLSGEPAQSWLARNIGVHAGTYAVYLFFAISGFLVAKSFARKGDLRAFVLARVLRIIPALLVVSVISAVILGPILTTGDKVEYFRDSQVWKYVVNNSLMIHTEYKLPGVFTDNPFPDAVNGSLWSLRYEMRFYILIALLGMMGVLLFRNRFLLFSALFLMAYLSVQVAPEWFGDVRKTRLMFSVGLYFYLGMVIFYFRRKIRLGLSGLMLFPVLAGLCWFTVLRELGLAIALAYYLFYLALVPAGAIRFYNRLGDYSYGFYLYAFPIQQTLVLVFPQAGFYQVLAGTTFLTLLMAILSWHLVEKPALGLRTARPMLPRGTAASTVDS